MPKVIASLPGILPARWASDVPIRSVMSETKCAETCFLAQLGKVRFWHSEEVDASVRRKRSFDKLRMTGSARDEGRSGYRVFRVSEAQDDRGAQGVGERGMPDIVAPEGNEIRLLGKVLGMYGPRTSHVLFNGTRTCALDQPTVGGWRATGTSPATASTGDRRRSLATTHCPCESSAHRRSGHTSVPSMTRHIREQILGYPRADTIISELRRRATSASILGAPNMAAKGGAMALRPADPADQHGSCSRAGVGGDLLFDDGVDRDRGREMDRSR